MQKIFENQPESSKNFDILKIIDWLMQASQILRLSKNTFFTAVLVTKKVYSKERNHYFSGKLIEIQTAAILSLSAKFQSNKINFLQAISTMCGFNKPDLVDGQIFIMKNLDFKFPYMNIQQKIIATCHKWSQFVQNNTQLLKMSTKKVTFGTSINVLDWGEEGRRNLIDFGSLSDLILLSLNNKFDYDSQNQVIFGLLQALFMLVNYHNFQLFPLKFTQKTYITMLFQSFLNKYYAYSYEQYIEWLKQLIKNQQKLRLVQKVSHYFNSLGYLKVRQDSSFQSITQCSIKSLPTQNYQYLNQRYRKFLIN